MASPFEIAIRQIDRWIIAARQDAHPAVRLLHATYATGDVDMLRQMYPDDLIYRMTGRDMGQLAKQASQLQSQAEREFKRACPQLFPY